MGSEPVGLDIDSADAPLKSVGRALAALTLLVDAAPRTVRVTDVARRLEIDSATAHRLLATLVSHRYASRMPNRTYTVGPRSLSMATAWLRRLRAAAAGPLSRVAAATGETVVVVQLLGDYPVALEWRRPQTGAPHLQGPADSYPLWATAGGRALLSVLPKSQRAGLLPEEPFPSLTGQTTTAWSELHGQLRDGIRDGLFFEHGEVDPRLWCCAVPLDRGSGGEVLSLSVIVPGEPSAAQRGRIQRVLRHESRRVGLALSGR